MAQGRGSATRGLALGALLAAAFLLLLGVADAATHRVDWSFNADSWSKGKSFRAGDVLEFNYDPSVHNVVAVDAGGYNGCRPSGTSYGSGSDRITLGPGTSYFICSLNGHCGMGMKMVVNAS
ncbi:Basic blue protein [Zea mays]|uniref:Plantacyanin n=2 Tax=Zea mays TaxID=4577 RepID=A0A3L6DRB9_MAIZE|nr:Basic blue protein [Zea mays]PWZ54303.1 Basic blue protein [Zea mays]